MTFREGRHNSNGKNESLNNVPRAGKRRESGRRSKSRATTPRRHPPPSCHTRRRFRSRGTRVPLALSCCAKWISFLASCYFFFFFFFSVAKTGRAPVPPYSRSISLLDIARESCLVRAGRSTSDNSPTRRWFIVARRPALIPPLRIRRDRETKVAN